MTIRTDNDKAHLSRAIELAHKGERSVKPNPVVGAVVARGEEILGEGWHEQFGGAHAEVNAIEACGLEDLADATLYVSLEPCCHEGKTPPCTDAILQAGIRRVVVASDDPTEKAAGRGLGILRDEGIEVVVADGDLAAKARLLNQAFRKHARVGRPWVLFKSAMTLDGKVATRTGDSQWISGESSRALAHRWRASVDAVVVGIGTALADDPQLTARPGGEPAEAQEQPRRVVFDTLARIPLSSQLVTAAAEIPLTVVVSRAAARAAGAHVIAVASSHHDKYLEALGAQEIIDYDKESVAEKAKASIWVSPCSSSLNTQPARQFRKSNIVIPTRRPPQTDRPDSPRRTLNRLVRRAFQP